MTMERNRRIMISGLLLLVWIGCACDGAWAQPASSSPPPFAVPYYAPPNHIDLCGEPVPLHDQEVRERFDREFTVVVYSHAQVYLWLKRMERYFPQIEKELAYHKLPDDLKYVAVAESDLLLSARSPAGAVGPWQFIPATGRSYGLSQSGEMDERHDFEKATSSAFRYLKDLHQIFKNWPLAIAAYNCGEGRVKDELKRQRLNDYYSLKLPLETERYVLRILAIKAVLSQPERYGYALPKGAGYPEIRVDRVNVRLASSVPLQSVAECAGVTFREFKRLNPSYTATSIPAGSHAIKVPAGRATEFERRLAAIKPMQETRSEPKAESHKIVYHKVDRGETLSGIAGRHKVSVQDLRKWNNLKGDGIRIGQVIKIVK